MIAEFDIRIDPACNLVCLTLRGFFQPADVDRFVSARDEAHLKLRCGPNEHSTLVDIRDMEIQSQEAVTHFQRTLANPAMISKHIAIVLAEKSLCRLQVRRAVAQRDARYFDSMGEAEAYLTGARSIAA